MAGERWACVCVCARVCAQVREEKTACENKSGKDRERMEQEEKKDLIRYNKCSATLSKRWC